MCRDYAHLAIALCRCMNVPARYCTGYLGDMGTEPPYGPGDFAAWFEAYLGGRWHIFDPRNNVPRIGRILMARGRDATDVALVTSFGPCTLAGFKVFTDEVAPTAASVRRSLEHSIPSARESASEDQHALDTLCCSAATNPHMARWASPTDFTHRKESRVRKLGQTIAAHRALSAPLVDAASDTGANASRRTQAPLRIISPS